MIRDKGFKFLQQRNEAAATLRSVTSNSSASAGLKSGVIHVDGKEAMKKLMGWFQVFPTNSDIARAHLSTKILGKHCRRAGAWPVWSIELYPTALRQRRTNNARDRLGAGEINCA